MVSKMKNFLKFKTGETGHDMRKFGEEFYLREARLWRPFRWFGMLSTILAMVLTMTSIFNENWLSGKGAKLTTPNLHPSNQSSSTVSRDFECSLRENHCMKMEKEARLPNCSDELENWQTAVIGLMIFSAGFGFVAAILGICGVCTSPLPKKIYYFHSAGEIFFVCALSTTIALIIYAVSISTDETIESHVFGTGYRLGWGGTAFFFAASFCMSLDELVRESAQNKCCRYICFRSRSDDDDNSHPV